MVCTNGLEQETYRETKQCYKKDCPPSEFIGLIPHLEFLIKNPIRCSKNLWIHPEEF